MFRVAVDELFRAVLGCGKRIIYDALTSQCYNDEGRLVRFHLAERPDKFEQIDETNEYTIHMSLYKRLYWLEAVYQYCLENYPDDAARLVRPILKAQDAFLDSRMLLVVSA